MWLLFEFYLSTDIDNINILGAVSVEDFGLGIGEFHAVGAGVCAGRFHFDVLLCVALFLSMVLL